MSRVSGTGYNNDDQRWSALMVGAQKGNEEDYQQLLKELSDTIARYLRSRIGNYHFVEDCVQETLIAIHQARHTYDGKRLFRPWLFAIIRHKTIDILRRHVTYQRLLEGQHIESSVSNDNFSEQLERDIEQGRLMNALSPSYKQAITLTKIVGLTVAEAATKLSISESALKVRVHRAVGQLKKLLEADEL